MKVKIGIITPTYNRPDCFLRLHLSLLNTGEGVDWVHCAVNDGSTLSYEDVITQCVRLSGRLCYKQIDNKGPLVARNNAIDMALSENCTHICFIDDDDLAINYCLQSIQAGLIKFSEVNWFIFGSKIRNEVRHGWPTSPISASWFRDVVLKKAFAGDNLHVISTDFVGNTRFSERGRNQREWTLFIKLSRKDDTIMVMPDIIMLIDYQFGGLTDQASTAKYSSPQSLFNNIERSYCYWRKTPKSPALLSNFVRQLVLFPLKAVIFYIDKAFALNNGRSL